MNYVDIYERTYDSDTTCSGTRYHFVEQYVQDIGTSVIKTDIVLDLVEHCLLYFNPQHGLVFLKQPVDFPCDYSTSRRMIQYVKEQVLSVDRDRLLDEFVVYHDSKWVAIMYKEQTVILYALTPIKCKAIMTRVDINYTDQDTLQTAFDRARVVGRILAQQHKKANKKKSLGCAVKAFQE